MTKQRILQDGKDTDFSAWLRQQPEIDSQEGYITTDLDFIWTNYKTGEWMILEEKSHGGTVPRWQGEIMQKIDLLGAHDPKYKGAFLVRFENTNPQNGRVMVNKKLLNRDQLIQFLQFKLFIEPVPLHSVQRKK